MLPVFGFPHSKPNFSYFGLFGQLSQNGETFPGTEERIVLITSSNMQPVLMAVSLVLQKVAEVRRSERCVVERFLHSALLKDQTSEGSIEGRFSLPEGAGLYSVLLLGCPCCSDVNVLWVLTAYLTCSIACGWRGPGRSEGHNGAHKLCHHHCRERIGG